DAATLSAAWLAAGRGALEWSPRVGSIAAGGARAVEVELVAAGVGFDAAVEGPTGGGDGWAGSALSLPAAPLGLARLAGPVLRADDPGLWKWTAVVSLAVAAAGYAYCRAAADQRRGLEQLVVASRATRRGRRAGQRGRIVVTVVPADR
ncbi:MAG TPA: hypothetical protein VF796_21775, partial [Humisphaera sp.]